MAASTGRLRSLGKCRFALTCCGKRANASRICLCVYPDTARLRLTALIIRNASAVVMFYSVTSGSRCIALRRSSVLRCV